MTEIRRDEKKRLDELVCDEAEFVHLENLDHGDWWLGIDTPAGRVSIFLHGRGRIKANVIDERET